MEQCQCKRDKDFDRLDGEFKDFTASAALHVTWTVFWSIVLLLVGIFGASINSTQSSIKEVDTSHVKQIQALEDKVNSAAVAQAKIDTQLANIQLTLADIQLKLAKIK